MMKKNRILFVFIFLTTVMISCHKDEELTAPEDPSTIPSLQEKWVCTVNDRVAIQQFGEPTIYLTQNQHDHKTVWSPNGEKISFFRSISIDFNDPLNFAKWRNKICVIDANGDNFKQLTSGAHPDFNPTWTRDGSNKILINRYSPQGGWNNKIYLMSPDDPIGAEVLISDPSVSYEWANSGLKDGRIFIDRYSDTSAQSFLLTPNPGGEGSYEEISRPPNHNWKMPSVSPSETKVTYMLDLDRNFFTYTDVLIAYADLDVGNLEVKNPHIITEDDPEEKCIYPRWSPDEKFIIYASNRSGIYQMYAYSLEYDTTYVISSDINSKCRYGGFFKTPK